MNDEMTRKHFLKLGVGAATVALLPGCPADDDTDTGAGSTSTGDSNTSPTSTDMTTTSPTSTSPTSTDATTTDTTTDATTTSPTTDTEGTETSSETDPDSGSSTAASSDESSSSGNEESSSTGTMFDGCTAEPTYTFSGHVHTIDISLADAMAGVMVQYDAGGQMHVHTVTLTAGDWATLNSTGTVMVNSSFDSMHMHTVTINCV